MMAGVHVRRCGERGTQTFAHINDGVDEHTELQRRDRLERGPLVVDAAQEGDGDDDHAEDEADLLRLDACADDEAERAGDE